MMRRSQIHLFVTLVTVGFILVACGSGGGGLFKKGPADVAKAAYMAANEGRYSEVEQYLSSDAINAVKSSLGAMAGGMKGIWDKTTRNGTIERIEILKEEIRGEGARVQFKIYFKGGATKEDHESLIQEKGSWKITIGA
jgi:hypothetical protein